MLRARGRPQGEQVVIGVRQGSAAADRDEARVQLERMCEQLLTNPLIESYEIAFGGSL